MADPKWNHEKYQSGPRSEIPISLADEHRPLEGFGCPRLVPLTSNPLESTATLVGYLIIDHHPYEY